MAEPIDSIYACIKRAALAATPAELAQLEAELRQAQVLLELVSASRFNANMATTATPTATEANHG